ncbi:hypothetical protein RN001_006733 [Aquatica leii]|uniref:Major facilitator superfamily (MFS) profile domain-containing protein n=1 Tax=Aquatica leii TaxID=1421715 RepID=A0AAN7Q227_9COLE|nr:hypothetical protein RN001_006733 [Aquatica leii]
MQDFNLHCDDNIKLLTIVGTFNGIGKFIGLPIAGFLSDRYGRKTVLICGTVTSGIFAIIRSFSTSYTFFIVFEFLESVFVAGIYASAYVLGSEFVGPKKRALIATIQFMSFGIGSVILGSLAWLIQSWRILLRVLYVFYLVVITYYWLLPESVRWLLAKKRQEEAVNTIRKIAKINKSTITEGALENLINTNDTVNTNSLTLKDLFKSTTLTIRCAISSFCWMSTIFVYYGLSITSTTLSGNRYFDFILTSAIEVPAYATACLIINKLGRKPCVAGALTLSTVSSIAFIVLPIHTHWIKLLIYLTSKFGITMCVSGLYMITNEMFPTSLRQTLLSICSMFGRIGNVLAPQLFLLIEIWKYFPLVLFATLTGISALLTIFLPETKETQPSESEIIDQILRNLNPYFSERVSLHDVDTLDRLKELCLKVQDVKSRIDKYHPPPQKRSVLLEPDLAYVGLRNSSDIVSSVNNSDSNVKKCFNCGYQGHMHRQCPKPASIFCFGCAMAFFGSVIYVFEAKQVNHRCEIPECESNPAQFKPEWWKNAIPTENENPSKCSKFRRHINSTKTCNLSDFNQEIEDPCEKFVYETKEISILHDFNLQCNKNVWKLTLVGTIHGLGLFIGLPITGILSDRFGRKTILIYAMLISGMIGVLRTFSNSYLMFMILETVEQIFKSGIYAICYILGVELVGPKKRVLVGLLVSISYEVGGILEGGLAWYVQSWRTLIRILYAFHLIVILYYWLIPESVRWLLSKKRFSEAQDILHNVAIVNGKQISKENLKKLEFCKSNPENIKTNTVTELFSSLSLILTLIDCSICWICCIFLYIGLTINSVILTENTYFNFMMTIFAEVPGSIAAYLIVDKLGRKLSLTFGFLLSGVFCIISIFLSADNSYSKLIAYLIAKFGATITMSTIFTLTSEIFPTPFRNSLLATCSMFGRTGGMMASQMPLLATIWESLPSLLFGFSGLLAAFLTMLLPETVNTNLPSTIQEAEDIEIQSTNRKYEKANAFVEDPLEKPETELCQDSSDNDENILDSITAESIPEVGCEIPECESNPAQFKPHWWKNAIPAENENPSKCSRFQRLNNSTKECNFSDFNRLVVEHCKQFVYETEEISILQDVRIMNEKVQSFKDLLEIVHNQPATDLTLMKLSLQLEQFKPINTKYEDLAIQLSALNMEINPSVKEFEEQYFDLVAQASNLLELNRINQLSNIDSSINSTRLELVVLKKRVLVGLLISITYAVGGIIEGALAWLVQSRRCEISECESNPIQFKPDWWENAIPAENGNPSKCLRFRRLSNSSKTCNVSDFNREIKDPCEKFVYETREISILHDFNLQCNENIWKLTLVGTVHAVGLFIGLPITGILSDRFGRKTVLLHTTLISGIIGVTRSFSNSYLMFMVLILLEQIFRSGQYAICYTLGLELVSKRKRVLVGFLTSISYAFAGIFEGGLAWVLQSWRTLGQILNAFSIIAILYYWLIPESVRWLLSKKRFSEAQDILYNVAKVNGKLISKQNLKKLELCITNKENIKTNSVTELFSSLSLVLRLIICCICWMCCIFLYVGLTINSVTLSKNSYLDFILTILVEIPGSITAYVVVDRFGRKWSLSCAFLLSGLSCIGSIFISADLYWLKLVVYLLGKFGASVNVSIIYTLTGEMFPTPFRNSLVATGSMFGRIGSMVASQMPLLVTIWISLPLTLFGSAGILGAVLTLLLPETVNTILPSTIAEAINIGKQRLELVGPKKRVLVGTLISVSYALGGMFEGGVAWLVQSWRILGRILYAFHLILVFYYWLIPESVRWLLSKKRYSEAQDILHNVAKVNKKLISEQNLKKLQMYSTNNETIKINSVAELFSSLSLILRLINCSICWTCGIFLYIGLTVNSVALSENSYLDFMLTDLVEIPASIAALIIIDRLGRRLSLTSGFLVAALSCIGSIFISEDLYWLKLLVYLLGKFGASINICIIYTFTGEIFPTPFRNSLLATCSMFGRIGSMAASQMPLLATIWEPLPLTLFGSAGILAAFLILLLPETVNTNLPNTIEEAVNIGKQMHVVMTEDVNSLDLILVEVGEFGRYQRRICFFLAICVIIIYFSSIVYIFETKQVNHRCKIPGCDVEPSEYKPTWWKNAIPSKNELPSKCSRYKRIDNTTQSCKQSDFNHTVEIQCKSFVYETHEISIIHDFNLQCDENVWKLTTVGTIHSIGSIIGMPIFGILSDRFGRKTILIYGLVLSGVIGLARSFANSYILFVTLICLDSICRSGAYPTVWILGSELVGPKKRVLVTVIISTIYAVAGVFQGLIAWALQSWRILLQIVYSLHLLIVFYHWLIPESVRWLLAKNKFVKAKNVLEHLAKVNKKTISADTIKQLEISELNKETIKTNTVTELLVSSTLMLRLVNSAVCWACCIFLYNGLTINSVQLSGNSYIDYILTMVVEIPGSIIYVVVDKAGRRFPLAGGFLLTGLACIGSIFVPTDIYWLKLCLYLLGKFGVSVSVSVLYTVTTEVFPTPFRSSLLSICGMFGGLGAMAAPQMPLLENIWKPLPLALFGFASILITFLSLMFPETINTQLPNTIEEAENIGRKLKSDQL